MKHYDVIHHASAEEVNSSKMLIDPYDKKFITNNLLYVPNPKRIKVYSHL